MEDQSTQNKLLQLDLKINLHSYLSSVIWIIIQALLIKNLIRLRTRMKIQISLINYLAPKIYKKKTRNSIAQLNCFHLLNRSNNNRSGSSQHKEDQCCKLPTRMKWWVTTNSHAFRLYYEHQGTDQATWNLLGTKV